MTTLSRFKNLFYFRKSSITRHLTTQDYDYVFRLARKEDYSDILQLMENSYFVDEPSFSSLKLPISKYFFEDALQSLSQGLSFSAHNPRDKTIIGASINSTRDIWDIDKLDKFVKGLTDEKLRQLYNFRLFNIRIGNLWHTYGVAKVFDIEYLFVHPKFRKQGIANELFKQSLKLAKDCNYKVIRCIATNTYMGKICQHENMTSIYKLPYNAYLDRTKKPIFNPELPHVEYKIYIDRPTL